MENKKQALNKLMDIAAREYAQKRIGDIGDDIIQGLVEDAYMAGIREGYTMKPFKETAAAASPPSPATEGPSRVFHGRDIGSIGVNPETDDLKIEPRDESLNPEGPLDLPIAVIEGKEEEFHCYNEFGGGERCGSICKECAGEPPAGAEGEGEVPEDFLAQATKAGFDWAIEMSTAPDSDTPDWIITDFKAGAKWAFRVLTPKSDESKEVLQWVKEYCYPRCENSFAYEGATMAAEAMWRKMQGQIARHVTTLDRAHERNAQLHKELREKEGALSTSNARLAAIEAELSRQISLKDHCLITMDDMKKAREKVEAEKEDYRKALDDYLVKLVEMADWAWREHHRGEAHQIKMLLEKYGHELDQFRKLKP